MKKPGRNDPCSCGSGQKYKKCCLLKGAAAPSPPTPQRAPIKAGVVGPLRPVPAHIIAPPYAKTGIPARATKRTCLKTTDDEIARMRVACKVAREVLNTVLAAVEPGVTTDALDKIAHDTAIKLGAYPSPLNYRGFPKSLCTSVNEVICHGIPDDRRLLDGDIINCDITIYIGGMHGDCSETVFVGQVDAEGRRLVETAYACMEAGINAVKPGVLLNTVGRAVADVARLAGYSIVRDFGGHGIGEQFHMPPHVMHHYERSARTILKPGMTFTVEPMINQGDWRCNMWSDDWTAVTSDRRRSAQFEHTLLVTETGVERLTDDGLPWFKR